MIQASPSHVCAPYRQVKKELQKSKVNLKSVHVVKKKCQNGRQRLKFSNRSQLLQDIAVLKACLHRQRKGLPWSSFLPSSFFYRTIYCSPDSVDYWDMANGHKNSDI